MLHVIWTVALLIQCPVVCLFSPHFIPEPNYSVAILLTVCTHISGILKHHLITLFHPLTVPKMVPLSRAVHIPEFTPMAITAVMWPCSVPTAVSFYY